MTHNDLPDAVCDILESLDPPIELPVFVGEYPTDLDNCIAVWLDDAANISFFGQTEALGIPLIRFMIRTEDYVPGNDAAKRLVQVFKNTYSNGKDEIALSPIGTTQYMGKDENGRHEFRLNYKSIIKE